jgi:hypothetical protein
VRTARPTEQTKGTPEVKQPNTFSSLALNGLNKDLRQVGGLESECTCRHVATATLDRSMLQYNQRTEARQAQQSLLPAVANFEELLALEKEITREKEDKKEKPREKVEEEIS